MTDLIALKLRALKQQYDQLSDEDKEDARRCIKASIQEFEAKTSLPDGRSLDPAIKLLRSLLEYAETSTISPEASE